ncbi:rod shape-determining protein MreD [Croceivirga thetidis]|uniref:Rod shape-determining protein MreD n=1 Tax=Croceivirga thetidis TaxID=2721623 RepID=A0ABX1GQ22_9FLAO|nr:rod shape-determining protein MreD [Croceivirga thetidis]NKI31699.1 rod shape-determining protein MreD [Croceivirga thetidis]
MQINNTFLVLALRFLMLLLAQVLIFNDLGFLGFINPMVYVLFVYWYPLRTNRSIFLIASFLLGFAIDVFSDTLAIHSTSLLTVAFLRPLIMRFSFGAAVDFQGFTFKNTTLVQRVTFLAVLIFIHHTIFYSLEILSFSHFLLILKKILFIGIASLILSLLLSSLFALNRE